MESKVIELFCRGIESSGDHDWRNILEDQVCLYTGNKCFKVRKSDPVVSIGTCTVSHGRKNQPVIICPNRLLQKRQVFTDCVHLLLRHEPGNEFHVVPEVSIPGGSVDYFLVSAKDRKVRDFVGIEFQALDTSGTVYPERQKLLRELGFVVDDEDVDSKKQFGINWKMTAKTTLVQLHHKIETFEYVGKHLVLVVQDCLLEYMYKEFNFDHLSNPSKIGDSMHIHAYSFAADDQGSRLELAQHLSTDSDGVSTCLGLQVEARVELVEIAENIESRISDDTILTIV